MCLTGRGKSPKSAIVLNRGFPLRLADRPKPQRRTFSGLWLSRSVGLVAHALARRRCDLRSRRRTDAGRRCVAAVNGKTIAVLLEGDICTETNCSVYSITSSARASSVATVLQCSNRLIVIREIEVLIRRGRLTAPLPFDFGA